MLATTLNRQINTVKPVYYGNQKKILDRGVVLNAIDTLDIHTDEKEAQADYANNILTVLPTMLAVILPNSLLIPDIVHNKNKLLKKLFSVTVASTLLSTLIFGYFTNKRAQNSYQAYLVGQREGLDKHLDNPKLFVPLDNEKQKNISNNFTYNYYLDKKYSNDFNLNLDTVEIKKSYKFLKSLNNEDKVIDFTLPAENSDDDKIISETLNKIDNNSQKYVSKVMGGLNLLYSALGLGAVGVIAVVQKLASKNNRYAGLLNTLPPIILLLTICLSSKVSNTKFFDNLEQISRYRAKECGEGCLKSNDLETCIEYLKTKGFYKKKIQQHNDLVLAKNEIVKSMGFSDEELESAKAKQLAFIRQVKSIKRAKEIENNKLNNSFGRDFMLNTLLLPLFIPILTTLCTNVFDKGEKMKFNNKYLLFGVLTMVLPLINYGLIKHANSKK